jgi:hypothetical protein
VCERDQQRHLAVGAGVSPTDPDHPVEPPDDVVQAVVEFVDDLVDETDLGPGPLTPGP